MSLLTGFRKSYLNFLKGNVSYCDFYTLLRECGARLTLYHTRNILRRLGVRAGAFVLSTTAPDGCLYTTKQGRVFYVRCVRRSLFWLTPALFIEDSIHMSVAEAAWRGCCYDGFLLKAGLFHFFSAW